MTQRTLEKSVEDAEQTTNRVVHELAHRVRRVACPQRINLGQRVGEGEASINSMLEQYSKVQRFISRNDVLEAFREEMEGGSTAPRSQEERFRREEMGYRRPAMRFRSREEAHEHFTRTLQRSAQDQRPEGQLVRWIESNSDTIARTWFTPDYLGSRLHSRFQGSPPILTVESDQTYSLQDAGRSTHIGYGEGSIGRYFPGTNHMIVRESISNTEEADQIKTIVHEELHYASFLGGGGGDLRWRNENNEAVIQSNLWLGEGLTELHAQQLTRSHDYEPSHVSYPYETAVGFYMQKIVGAGVLRQAYLTGDYTIVRQRMDARLGTGTFDRMMSMSRGYQALSFIMGRMSAANINFTRWERDPILARCFVQIEGIEERGGAW